MGLGRLIKKTSHAVNRGLHKAANTARTAEKGIGRGIRTVSNTLGRAEDIVAGAERAFNQFDKGTGHLVSDVLRATPLAGAYGEVKSAMNLARMGVDGASDLTRAGGQLARAGINAATGHERRAMQNLERAGSLAARPAVGFAMEAIGDARGLASNVGSVGKGLYRAGEAARSGDFENSGRNLRRAYRNATDVRAALNSGGMSS